MLESVMHPLEALRGDERSKKKRANDPWKAHAGMNNTGRIGSYYVLYVFVLYYVLIHLYYNNTHSIYTYIYTICMIYMYDIYMYTI
jgi:hypothetical protein